MKKISIALILILVCLMLTACALKGEQQAGTSQPDTTQTEGQSTTQLPAENTTKAPASDLQKGEALKNAVSKQLGSKGLDGDFSYGKFTYKGTRDIADIYKFEYSDQFEKAAKDNANALVEAVSELYSDEITLHSFEAKQIGNGENGIDSVRYEFYYINTQNQLLTIYADSDSTISYADCSFTW